MSETQFNALKEAYAFGPLPSKVEYSAVKAGMELELVDLLPPAMQAVNGLHFHVQNRVYKLPSFVQGQESRAVDQKCMAAVNW